MEAIKHVSKTVIGHRVRSKPYPDHMVDFTAPFTLPKLTARRIPPNLKFEVDDVEREWTYPFKFDFIVCRYMAGSITDWPKLIERIYEYDPTENYG